MTEDGLAEHRHGIDGEKGKADDQYAEVGSSRIVFEQLGLVNYFYQAPLNIVKAGDNETQTLILLLQRDFMAIAFM